MDFAVVVVVVVVVAITLLSVFEFHLSYNK
jgi:hypothetical protein